MRNQKAKINRSYTADLIRALSIIMVFLCHSRYLGPAHDLYQKLTYFMNVSVDMFLTLSGFLLTTLYFSKIYEVKDFKYFYKNRWLKTLPLYIVFMIVNVCFFDRSIDNLGYYLTFTQNYFVPMAWFVTWSLCLEEWLYILFPPMLLFFRNRVRAMLSLSAAFILGALFWRATSYVYAEDLTQEWFESRFYFYSHLRLDSAIFGVFFALVRINWPTRKTVSNLSATLLLIAIVLSPLFFTLSRLHWYPAILHSFLTASFTGFWLWICWDSKNKVVEPIVFWLSETSYAIYLVHIPIFMFYQSLQISFLSKLFFSGFTTLIVGHFLRWKFEHYFLSFKSSVLKSRD